MKATPLTHSLFIVFLFVIFSGCDKEPCLDIAELDKRSALTREWFVDDSIGNRELSDSHGMSQTLVVRSRYSGEYDNMVEDDCGNTYGSFYFSIQYNISLSPLNFMIDINGSALEADGFYLQMTVTNTQTVEPKSTIYDFVSRSTRDDNATVVFIDQVEVSDKVYHEVLEFTFAEAESPNGVRTVCYAKGYGLIKYITENGNEFEVK